MTPVRETTVVRRMRWDRPTNRDSIEGTPIVLTHKPTILYGGSSINDGLLEAVMEIENREGVVPVDEAMDKNRGASVVKESPLSDHHKIQRLERLVCEMRDKNDEITDGFEVLISDITESKIGCTRCKVDVHGKCRAPIPLVAYGNVGHAPIMAVCAALVWEVFKQDYSEKIRRNVRKSKCARNNPVCLLDSKRVGATWCAPKTTNALRK